MSPNVLIVDDEPAFRVAMGQYLSRHGFAVHDAESLRAAPASLATTEFQAMLLDLGLPDGDGLDWIDEIRTEHQHLALLVITGHSQIPVAVEAMRRGADDFLTKPVDPSAVITQLRRCLFIDRSMRRVLDAIRADDTLFPPCIWRACEIAASCGSPVLITGETGSGKGVVARWIHDHSSRRAKELVEINCSSLRDEWLANELFGHARGAFTSATDAQPGLFDAADGGTLFLDEIGELNCTIQAQLLKTIEEKRYRRLGEVGMRSSDFRLIGATNHALEQDIVSGRFRRDLFYRINVLHICIPPLRERLAELPMLTRALLRTIGVAEIDQAALTMLSRYDWPGNIRQLRNVLERAALVAGRGTIRSVHLEGFDAVPLHADAKPVVAYDDIIEALRRNGGDKNRAAMELGISRATLYRRLQDLRRPGDGVSPLSQ